MAIPSLLGAYIDETYPRLVQVSGSEFADGLGNPITFGGGGSGSNANASFTNQSTWVFNHNLGNRFVIVEVFDTNYNQIIPQEVTLTSTNTVTITFPTSESGYAVASLGGAGGSGSANIDTGSFATTGSNIFRGNQDISGSVTITGSLTVSGSSTFTNIGPAIFSGSVEGIEGFTGSFTGSFIGDGANLINLPTQVGGSSNEIQYNISGSSFGGIPILTYDGTTVTATNINATGSFSGSFNDGVQKLILTGVTQTGISDPTYVTAENTFGDTFTFARGNAGEYELIFDNITPFTEDYTYAIISPGFASPITNAYSTFYEWISISRIKFWTVKNGTSGNDDVLVKATIEIRVYPTP